MVDPHVHLRDWSQSQSETLSNGFRTAWDCGMSAVFEMPNTDPPLNSKSALMRRRDDADAALAALNLPLRHGMYAGLTAEPDQILGVVRAWEEMYPRVVGLKLYAGHSTGNLGVTSVGAQRGVWETLARAGCRAVVAIHAEREDLLRPEAWDPLRPITHGQARPPLAEVASVQTQLALAEVAGFRGHIHFCHVSHPDTVRLVRAEVAGLPFTVSLGATPHHLLLTDDLAQKSAVPQWNVNPPLRDERTRQSLCKALDDGEIDWLESDHAPHTIELKRAGASGLPGMPGYRLAVERLLDGALFSTPADAAELHELTTLRVCAVFGLDPAILPDNPNSPFSKSGALRSPRPPFDYSGIAGRYAVDPYRPLDSGTGLPTTGLVGYAHANP
jgi:dihydroorotase